jgi:eukaryotic-like serine/threonine-protein kinase
MATVYLGHDELLQVDRAIKVLTTDLARMHSSRERFLTEARAMARLRHPHIVSVIDVGEDSGQPWMVMELVEGGTLGEHLETHGVLGARRAAEIGIEVLGALGAAHQLGIVHRDVKPQNILVTGEGSTRLTDFGIAHVDVSLGGGMTRAGAAVGTLGYMAPEQRTDARTADNRADLYAVGTLIFALVGGNVGLDLYSAALDPSVLDPLPPALRPVIEKATRFKPADRYGTAMEMAEALRATLDDLPSDPVSVPLGALAARMSSRSFTPAVSAVMTMVPDFDDQFAPEVGNAGASAGETLVAGLPGLDGAGEEEPVEPTESVTVRHSAQSAAPSAPSQRSRVRPVVAALTVAGIGLGAAAIYMLGAPSPGAHDVLPAPAAGVVAIAGPSVSAPPSDAGLPEAPTGPSEAPTSPEGPVSEGQAAGGPDAGVANVSRDNRPAPAVGTPPPTTASPGSASPSAPAAAPATAPTAGATSPLAGAAGAPVQPEVAAIAATSTTAAAPTAVARTETTAAPESSAPAAASGPDLTQFAGHWTGTALERPFTIDLVVSADGKLSGKSSTRLGAQSLTATLTGTIEVGPAGALRFVARESSGGRGHTYEGSISSGGASGKVVVKGRAAGTFSVAR